MSNQQSQLWNAHKNSEVETVEGACKGALGFSLGSSGSDMPGREMPRMQHLVTQALGKLKLEGI